MALRVPRFNPHLESLRGGAALAVCFTHSLAIYRMDGQPAIWRVPLAQQTPGTGCLTVINALFNPQAAVILFFILSGYVLTQSMRAAGSLTRREIAAFYVRRAWRILPMFWVSLLLIYALSRLDHAGPTGLVSDWYTFVFMRPLGWHELMKNALLVDFQASPVTWTMRVELLGSLVMPLLVYVVSRQGLLLPLLFLGLMIGLALRAPGDFSYLICFYIGALLARWDRIVSWEKWSLFLVAGGLLAGAALRLSLLVDRFPRFTLLATTVAAAALLLGVLAAPRRFTLLDSPPCRLLGRLSYSLYLLHPAMLGLMAMLAFALGLCPRLPVAVDNLLIFVLSVVAALGLSLATYRWVEVPSINLGQRWSRPSRYARLEVKFKTLLK